MKRENNISLSLTIACWLPILVAVACAGIFLLTVNSKKHREEFFTAFHTKWPITEDERLLARPTIKRVLNELKERVQICQAKERDLKGQVDTMPESNGIENNDGQRLRNLNLINEFNEARAQSQLALQRYHKAIQLAYFAGYQEDAEAHEYYKLFHGQSLFG